MLSRSPGKCPSLAAVGKSALSFLQTAVLSRGVYLIQRNALLVCCQHTLLEVISFPEKNRNQTSQTSSYKISDDFRICQKAKQAFISAFPDSKAKHRRRRKKLKWRKQGVELDWGMWVFCIPRVASGFPRAEGDVFSIRMMWPKGGFSSSPSSGFLFSFLFSLPSHKRRVSTVTSGFFATRYSLTYLQNSLILQCREEQMALIMEEKMLSQADALQV